ncbi:GNAT family N-acetyltransferase [Catenulispora sp. NF23]|uniref:GNAT family N-acetyltransferase n=1 Tax=Catenulispora pinistramenti TaxID=2705254 RepID=A0ABS5KIE1_9ACTN|nr:GNAT family N-acetyltransferase [Catenulispora pinistramenti]MBS2531599.1 GNAT family N-acetyltransferase [Catenulispora pinistramenti]MBS2546151.1 GNAT family N-acetyltransferase [Catenulispora pinistramenti]
MNSRDQIVQAQPRDINTLSHVIAKAFHNLAPSTWLIPDSDARARLFPGYFRLFAVHEAITRGRVYTTTGRNAVALWLPPTASDEPAPADYEAKLAATTGIWAERFRTFDGLLAKHHPHGIDHDHLAILAVHPDYQHQGIGSALLAAHHDHLGAEDPPRGAYLEASDATTRELYLRHGYTDIGEPIVLPSGACMFPMLRSASSA